jgi:hypothetical protein
MSKLDELYDKIDDDYGAADMLIAKMIDDSNKRAVEFEEECLKSKSKEAKKSRVFIIVLACSAFLIMALAK